MRGYKTNSDADRAAVERYHAVSNAYFQTATMTGQCILLVKLLASGKDF